MKRKIQTIMVWVFAYALLFVLVDSRSNPELQSISDQVSMELKLRIKNYELGIEKH